MKKIVLSMALAAIVAGDGPSVLADDRGNQPLTIAVFGDWPYSQNLLTNAPLLINSVNTDPAVSLVIHVGDIHSGSMPCTSAGITSPNPIAGSNPDWNRLIYAQFQQFNAPVVYTPGDNEWTDCHKTKEFKSGAPLNELQAVRQLFFARPGKTLGLEDRDVWSQAQHYDPAHPSDAEFVENVIWENGKVVFVTLNLPGSNNDNLVWTNGFEDLAARTNEIARRTDADMRWLDTAFKLAKAHHSRAVVIALQADMWDPAALAPGGDGLNGYTAFVQKLAGLARWFDQPVLLLNGDSHIYGSDRPLADPSSPTGQIHGTQAVPNLTRITVQGSTNAPAEWLRLTIDTNTPTVFSWTNVPYCNDPTGSC